VGRKRKTAVRHLAAAARTQTKVVITEYELPRLELATHDVAGDSKGNVWYSPHRSSYIGRLDPRRVPSRSITSPHPDALPGTHWIYVDRNDIVWARKTGPSTSIGLTRNGAVHQGRWKFFRADQFIDGR